MVVIRRATYSRDGRRVGVTLEGSHSAGGVAVSQRNSDLELDRLRRATAELDPPFALVDLDAFDANAHDLLKRAAGKPIRVASKSVRCKALQQRALAKDGFVGTLCFTLPEALWLAESGFDDLVVAYPTTHRTALEELGKRATDLSITIMVDSTEQLDFIDAVVPDRQGTLRVCIDIDAGLWLFGGRVKIGAKRSPLHDASSALEFARSVEARDGFEVVGLMAYEAQVAGVGDSPPGNPLKRAAIKKMQSRSVAELAERRAEIVHAVQEVAPLEFVNGGGTGSIETTVAESCITEVTAGSGLYGPALFSTYSRFSPKPAALFALSVVRRPDDRTATALGGGYLASGAADDSRLPAPYLPEGLELDALEGAGEVQTPLRGEAAGGLRVGDTVFFRHAKAGELCERFDSLHLIEKDAIVDRVPTYRGEGQTFL